MKLLKTLTLASLILISGTSQANPNHRNHHGQNHGYYNRSDWVAPLVIGGVLGYVITRPQPVIVQQPPIIVYPNTQPSVPYGYHYEQILDANCNCYRLVLVLN
jgi:hypothetical protein